MLENQRKLNAILENLTMSTLPRSLILLGDRGCGKHTLVKELSEKLSLEVVDITDSLTL